MRRSFIVLTEGGLPMWDDIKGRVNSGEAKFVRIVTDDTEISVGVLLRNNEKTVVVGTYTPAKHDLMSQQTGRAYRCQTLSIEKSRISELRQLN
jgi:hypothetical protein